MYRDLFINLAIIISFLFISGQLSKNKLIHFSNTNKVIAGVIAGIVGIILMLFTIQVTETAIMDLRNFVIIFATIYRGKISVVIASGIISLGRLFINGISEASITVVITILLLTIICILISMINLTNFKKFLYMNISNIVIVYCVFFNLISDKQKLFEVLFYYGIISIVGGFVIYYVSEYISHSNKNFRELKESAKTDFLTGLDNVRQFDTIWNAHILNAKEKNERLSILLIDLDHFKKINDVHGHLIGDKVLKEFAIVLKNSIRSFDTVSRNGGEEFSVILPDCPNDQAIEIAEKIRNAVEIHDFIISKSNKVSITVSIGIATFPETVEKINEMLGIADQCLYKAKHLGRNQVCS